jgi:hypothetical protein
VWSVAVSGEQHQYAGPQQHEVVVPGDRGQQEPRSEHGRRGGTGGVELVPPPAQDHQRADEHGQPQHGADGRGQPEPDGQAGQRGVVDGVGNGLGEADPQPLQPAARAGDQHPEQRRGCRGTEAGRQGAPAAGDQREQQQWGQRRLERHRDPVERRREERPATAFGDPAGDEPDEQQPVDLAEHERAVQRRRDQHRRHDGHAHPAGQAQLPGHSQHRADHHQQRQHREHPVRGEGVEQRERRDEHREQGRVEVPELGGGVVDVAAVEERDCGGSERVEVGVQFAHVRRREQRHQRVGVGRVQGDGGGQAGEHEQHHGEAPEGSGDTAGAGGAVRGNVGHDVPRYPLARGPGRPTRLGAPVRAPPTAATNGTFVGTYPTSAVRRLGQHRRSAAYC